MGDQSGLSKVKVSEPMTVVELAKQESYRTSISDELVSFDKSGLKPTETVEKVALPDDDVISSEKQHQELLTGVQTGVELKKTDTREPINPLDLAKLETSKDQVEEEVEAKGVAGLRDFLGKDEDRSSSPEELSVPA